MSIQLYFINFQVTSSLTLNKEKKVLPQKGQKRRLELENTVEITVSK